MTMKTASALLLLGTLALAVMPAYSQPQSPSGTAAVGGDGRDTQAQVRLVSEFSGFAGSDDNARSLVTGLRQSGEITLVSGSGRPAETATFTPATRPMGYGNVRIALALAREQLAQNGITQPTPDQLRAALAGGVVADGTGSPGSTTRLQGVLQMRADGMGWGRIAQSMGTKLGPVLSGKSGAQGTVAGSTVSTSAASAKTGITTGAGTASGTTTANGHGNSAWAHANSRADAGIVTAAGAPATGFSAGMRVHGGGGAIGVSTAAGAAAHGNGGGAGLAKGRGGN
jgi:hypothetical protein